jgi:hypothetical protein
MPAPWSARIRKLKLNKSLWQKPRWSALSATNTLLPRPDPWSVGGFATLLRLGPARAPSPPIGGKASMLDAIARRARICYPPTFPPKQRQLAGTSSDRGIRCKVTQQARAAWRGGRYLRAARTAAGPDPPAIGVSIVISSPSRRRPVSSAGCSPTNISSDGCGRQFSPSRSVRNARP